ncbi:MAG: hypothetical protein D6797_01280 [Bdellovibrio sp.]|nr:MAG: hypothetical protein D6797_01280 [Bdellovibrio sp.]
MKANQKGQLTVEALLLMVVFLGLSAYIFKEFKDRNAMASLVSSPWQMIDGMVQNGVWAKPEEGYSKHPNHINTHSSKIPQ